jgi:hypothetical protein
MVDKTIGNLTALGAQLTADTLIEIELAGVSYKVPVIQVRAGASVTPPVLANFATTSEDTASSSALVATSAAWGFNLTKINNATGNTNQWGSRLKSVPGGAAWTVTGLIERHFLLENFKGGGLILRESATSKFLNIGFTNDGGTLCVGKWNSNTSFASNIATVNEYTRLLWVRALWPAAIMCSRSATMDSIGSALRTSPRPDSSPPPLTKLVSGCTPTTRRTI